MCHVSVIDWEKVVFPELSCVWCLVMEGWYEYTPGGEDVREKEEARLLEGVDEEDTVHDYLERPFPHDDTSSSTSDEDVEIDDPFYFIETSLEDLVREAPYTYIVGNLLETIPWTHVAPGSKLERYWRLDSFVLVVLYVYGTHFHYYLREALREWRMTHSDYIGYENFLYKYMDKWLYH